MHWLQQIQDTALETVFMLLIALSAEILFDTSVATATDNS
jgi:hypothetical protein